MPESDLRDDQIDVITDAVSNGNTTVYGYEPFRNLEYVRLNGTYYQVRTTEAGIEEVEQPVLVVTPVANRSESVPLEEYGGHVMELVAPAEGEASSRVLHPDTPGFDALVPEPRHKYVTWENNTYRLTVEHRQVEQQARRVHVEVGWYLDDGIPRVPPSARGDDTDRPGRPLPAGPGYTPAGDHRRVHRDGVLQ